MEQNSYHFPVTEANYVFKKVDRPAGHEQLVNEPYQTSMHWWLASIRWLSAALKKPDGYVLLFRFWISQFIHIVGSKFIMPTKASRWLSPPPGSGSPESRRRGRRYKGAAEQNRAKQRGTNRNCTSAGISDPSIFRRFAATCQHGTTTKCVGDCPLARKW